MSFPLNFLISPLNSRLRRSTGQAYYLFPWVPLPCLFICVFLCLVKHTIYDKSESMRTNVCMYNMWCIQYRTPINIQEMFPRLGFFLDSGWFLVKFQYNNSRIYCFPLNVSLAFSFACFLDGILYCCIQRTSTYARDNVHMDRTILLAIAVYPLRHGSA